MVDNISTYINETNFPKATTTEITNDMLDHATGSVATKFPDAATKLKGKLVIKDYPLLKGVTLSSNELEEVTFINCPELTHIYVDGNLTLTKLDIEKLNINAASEAIVNKLDTLYCGESGIVEIDFTYCEDLKDFGCPNNPHLDRIINIDHVKGIEKINMSLSGPVKVMHAAKEAVFRGVVNEVKELFGVDTAAELPLVDWYNTKTKRIEKRVNRLRLKEQLEEKIMAAKNPQLTKEVKEVKEKLESQKDYEEIKTEQNQLKQQLENIRKELGLGEDATEQQFLEKIKELKEGPNGPACTHTDYDTIKSERDSLKIDNENKKRKIDELGDNKENVITKKVLTETTNTNWENWGIEISDSQRNLIQNAVSAEKVEEVRNEIIKSEFSKLKDESISSLRLNVGLGILAIGSLLILGWVLMWQTKLPELEIKKEKK